MGRDETDIRVEIKRRVDDLRGDIGALENSEVIDESVRRELMQIVEDIEGHVRVAIKARIRLIPD